MKRTIIIVLLAVLVIMIGAAAAFYATYRTSPAPIVVHTLAPSSSAVASLPQPHTTTLPLSDAVRASIQEGNFILSPPAGCVMQGNRCVVASGTAQAPPPAGSFLGYLNADVTAAGSHDIFVASEITHFATSSVVFEVIFVPGQDASTAIGPGGALGRSLFGISPKPGGTFSGMRWASSTRVFSLDVSYPPSGGASARTETFSYNILTGANGKISAILESTSLIPGVTSP